MTAPVRILVAGIGNIFLGDDAFGVHVAQKLLQRPQPQGVRVVDFGIRGLDLAYALLDGCEAAVLIDAVPRGEAPGTLFIIDPEPPSRAGGSPDQPEIEAHSMHPEKVLQLVSAMGGSIGCVRVVGCEPTPIDPEQDMQMELSPPVQAAIEPAVKMVESLIAEFLEIPSIKEIRHASENIEFPA